MLRLATVLTAAALVAVGLTVWAEPPADPDDPPVLLKKKGKPEGEAPAPPTGEEKKPDALPKDGAAKEPPAAEPEESEEEVLQRVSKNLRTAEERLANQELGDATSQVQDDVIKDLDALIERSERPPQGEASNGDSSDSSSGAKGSTGAPKSSGKSGRTAKSGSSGKSGSQTTAKNGGESPRGGEKPDAGSSAGGQEPSTGDAAHQGGGGGTGETGPKDKNPDLYKDVWGHLPETLRAEMNAYANTKGFMPEYETLISKYYSTIAEQGRRKGD
jgi:hypothetical protein